MPGLPGVIIGHNDRIAWGITNLGFDVQDLYVEQNRSQHGPLCVQGHRRTGASRAGADPRQRRKTGRAHELDHSPRSDLANGRMAGIGDPLDRRRAGQDSVSLSSNWTWRGTGKSFARRCSRLQRRPAIWFTPTWTETSDTRPPDSFLSGVHTKAMYLQMASAGRRNGMASSRSMNCRARSIRASGMIVTANQNPFPADYKYESAVSLRRITGRSRFALLSKASGSKPEDMLAIQKDVYSALLAIHRAAGGCGIRQARREERISANRRRHLTQMEWSNGARIAAPLDRDADLSATPASGRGSGIQRQGRALGNHDGRPGGRTNSPRSPAEWFRDYDQLVLRCFVDAMEEGRRSQGRDPNRWKYGDYLETTLRNPVLGPAELGETHSHTRQILPHQHRAGSDERIVDDGEADDEAPGSFNALHCGPVQLGSFHDERYAWTVRADHVAALQRSMGSVLHGPQLPAAFYQGRRNRLELRPQ